MGVDRPVPERREVKAALKAAGLSNRQADALLRSGWRGLVDASEAEAAELRDQLAALQAVMGAGLAKPADRQ